MGDKGEPYGKVYTGYVKVRMVVESIIHYFIQVWENKVTVKYQGQFRTCALFDCVEHLAAWLPAESRSTYHRLRLNI